MTRKETTEYLSRCTENYINPHKDPRIYWAREVSINFGKTSPELIGKKDFINDSEAWGRVDYMQFKPLNNSVSGIEKGDFYCYEIKSCQEDLHSGHGWNFFGDFNYFVVTEELYEKEKDLLNSLWSGVLVAKGNTLVSVKKAHRRDRRYSVSTLLLCMFRSMARDVRKIEKEE